MNWSFLKAWNKKTKIKKVENIKDIEFPCSSDKCLVRIMCTQACEKLEMDDDKLMKLFIKYNACPDCGCESFREGPRGGGCQNVKCDGCGHWFNLGLPLFIERVYIDKKLGGFIIDRYI